MANLDEVLNDLGTTRDQLAELRANTNLTREIRWFVKHAGNYVNSAYGYIEAAIQIDDEAHPEDY